MAGAVEWLFGIINALIASLTGTDSLLTADLTEGIPAIYQYAVAAQQIVLPVGYTVLALFFLIELFNCAKRVESAGGGSSMGVEMILGILIKTGLCKAVMDNVDILMIGLYDGFNYITVKLSSSTGLSQAAIALQEPDMSGVGFIAGLGVFVVGLIVLLLAAFTWIRSRLIIYARFIELYIFLIISPIPLATLPGDEWGQIGKNFLKKFAALAIQGTLIYLVLSFFPIIVGAVVLNFETGEIGGGGAFVQMLLAAFYCLLLLFALQGTSRLADSICNAM